MSKIINNPADLITICRIAFAAALPFVTPFSTAFRILYCICGVSDIADGFIARRLHIESKFGAMLDSIADTVFFIAAAIPFVNAVPIPVWLWLCIICTLLIRLVSYGIGLIKYHSFVSVHTYGNKAAGILLFMSPLLFYLFGLNLSVIIVSSVSILSAAEELTITLLSKEPQYECKSILSILI